MYKKSNTISTEFNYNNKDSFSHYQPSLNFINLLFKDNKNYYERYKEGVKEFSPDNVISLKKDKLLDKKSINSRFFGKSKYKFPPIFMSYDNTMPGYLNEKERLERNNMHTVEKKFDKELREKIRRRKHDIDERWNNMIKFQQKVLDVKESLGQINRTKHLFEYEDRNIARHQINE